MCEFGRMTRRGRAAGFPRVTADFVPVWADDFCSHENITVYIRLIDDFALDKNRRQIGADFRGCHKLRPQFQMHWIDDLQMRMSVDARSGVPARGGLLGVVATDSQNVLLTVAEV